MTNDPKFPSWLVFADRAPDDGTFLRLMVLNPVNDAVSTMVNCVIETDPPLNAPGPDDLHIEGGRKNTHDLPAC
ncbi:hypothetical protein KKH27_02295 [bacterium]|nr:hypothetical protein [bacterium]MBU1983968.1 hypothetical protein [bacterium]